MRAVAAKAQAIRERREKTVEVPMLWIDGALGEIGIWGGPGHERIAVVDMFTGQTAVRDFYGVGALLEVTGVRHEAGFNIRPATVSLSSISDAVRQAIRGYDPRGAQAQVWKRVYEPDTMKPVAIEPWFKGYVNSAPIERPIPGGEAGVELEIVSTARTLTIASNAKKSDAAQKLRIGDRFRRYKANTGSIDVAWGTKDMRS